MKPIAQTFYVNEPENGAAGVYLTSVDLFFQSKHPTFGVRVQIRQTENGQPTKFVMPHSDITYNSSSVNVSNDASVATKFTFEAPVFLQNLTSYAIVIIPVGGNPDYKIWTAELAPGTVDITTNTPIKTNNDTGTLFISSNDIQFTSLPNEDIKFNLYVAKFKFNSGKAVFSPSRTDYFQGKDKIGTFYQSEMCFISNNVYNLTRLNISSNTAAFQNGEILYQSNSTTNAIAMGAIYSANTTSIKLSNSVGSWSTSLQVKGATSLSNAVIATSGVFSNVITTLGSNSITVPFTNSFSTGQMIYVGAHDRSYMQASLITSIVNGTTLQLKENVNFSENDSMFGRIRGDSNLYGFIKVKDEPNNPNIFRFLLDNVTSNTTVNFYTIFNKYLIGASTGSSLITQRCYDTFYNTIVPQFSEALPGDSNNLWSFIGTKAAPTRPIDSDPVPLTNNIEKELYDYPRVLMSRSTEYSKINGDDCIQITADMSTSNNYISPVIDDNSMVATFVGNSIVPARHLQGYRIKLVDPEPYRSYINPFNLGDIVKQSNTETDWVIGTGEIVHSLGSIINIANVNGYFNDVCNIQLVSDESVNVGVSDFSYYSEINNANYPYTSRYISKSVVLAEGQDAEDIRVFLTAYRPATTDFLVYGRFQNSNDPETFQAKNWTLLDQISSPALLSSTVNKQDFVELEYSLPKTIELFPNSCNCVSTSPWIDVRNTENVKKGDYIYLNDNNSANFFVGRIMNISSTIKTKIQLISKAPFSIANASFGVIPNLQSVTSAFVKSDTGIVRYLSQDQSVYDTYKTFAIKIVPVSETTAIVPRAADMRAIALQV